MGRAGWMLLVLAVAVFAGVWYFAGRSQAPAPVLSGSAVNAPANAGATSAGVPDAAAVPAPAGASGDDVSRWIAEANGADAVRRGEAITALARAPRAQALPVLHHILINGEPGTDRPLALGALRELALDQGDADGKVREAIREVIYHSDGQDETLLAGAQDALDVVEESEMK